MAIKIEYLGIIVQFAYNEESAIGAWTIEPIVKETGPCQHAVILYTDGDMALAHSQKGRATQFEYFDDEPVRVTSVQ